jgi:YVTN family beta-propeller protein
VALHDLTTGSFTTSTILLYDASETPTLTATHNAMTGTSNAITVNPANLDHFVWSVIGAQIAGVGFTATVTAQDAFDNLTTKDTDASAFTATESITFSSTATAAPDTTVPTYGGDDLTDGSVALHDLTTGSFTTSTILLYDASETPTLTATHNAISAVSNAITVDPGPANNLAFLQQPTDAGANVIIAPAITVQVRDAFNNILTADNATSVGIAIGTNPGGGALAGTTPQTASSGVATFADLSINNGGVGYTLDATSAGLIGATSDPFTIIAPPAPAGGAALDADAVNDPVIDSLTQLGGVPVSFEALGAEEAGAPSRFFYGGEALYVTTVDGVEIYELSTHKLLANFEWRETPSNIFSSSRDGAVYVLMPRSNRILILNSDAPGRRSILGLKGQPADMAMSPDGSVAYVTHSLNDTVQVLDLKKKKMRFMLPAGSMPGSAVLMPDGRHLFVANVLDHTVSKMDALTGKVLGSFPAGGVPSALSLSRNGKELYVADSSSDKLLVFDTARLTLEGEIPTGHSPGAMKPDAEGKLLFVSNRGGDSISFIDLAGRKEIAQVPVGRRPSGMAVDHEGGRLYVANELSGDLSVIDIASRQVVKTIDVGAAPSKLAINQTSEARA